MSTGTTPSAAPGASAVAPPRTFVKHTTTNPAPVHPFINTSLPPINVGAPIELDSTPVSPGARKDNWRARPQSTIAEPGADQKAYEELSEEAGTNENIRQKRKELLEERQKDPGVLVDIPDTPGPEEYGIAIVGTGQGVARKSSVDGVTPSEVASAAGDKA